MNINVIIYTAFIFFLLYKSTNSKWKWKKIVDEKKNVSTCFQFNCALSIQVFPFGTFFFPFFLLLSTTTLHKSINISFTMCRRYIRLTKKKKNENRGVKWFIILGSFFIYIVLCIFGPFFSIYTCTTGIMLSFYRKVSFTCESLELTETLNERNFYIAYWREFLSLLLYKYKRTNINNCGVYRVWLSFFIFLIFIY